MSGQFSTLLIKHFWFVCYCYSPFLLVMSPKYSANLKSAIRLPHQKRWSLFSFHRQGWVVPSEILNVRWQMLHQKGLSGGGAYQVHRVKVIVIWYNLVPPYTMMIH